MISERESGVSLRTESKLCLYGGCGCVDEWMELMPRKSQSNISTSLNKKCKLVCCLYTHCSSSLFLFLSIQFIRLSGSCQFFLSSFSFSFNIYRNVTLFLRLNSSRLIFVLRLASKLPTVSLLFSIMPLPALIRCFFHPFPLPSCYHLASGTCEFSYILSLSSLSSVPPVPPSCLSLCILWWHLFAAQAAGCLQLCSVIWLLPAPHEAVH